MTDEDRASYKRQFAQAESRLLKREVITGCRWQDGRLSVTVEPKPKGGDKPAEFVPRVKRGVQQRDLFTR